MNLFLTHEYQNNNTIMTEIMIEILLVGIFGQQNSLKWKNPACFQDKEINFA